MKGKIMQSNLFKIGKGVIIFLFLFVFLSIIKPTGAETIVMSVDSQASGKPLRHVWSFFGFDECNFAYTDNAKELMKTLATTQKDPVYLRCHFLLNTGDGTPAMKWGSTNAYTEDASGKLIYDWKIMDRIFDAMIKQRLSAACGNRIYAQGDVGKTRTISAYIPARYVGRLGISSQ